MLIWSNKFSIRLLLQLFLAGGAALENNYTIGHELLPNSTACENGFDELETIKL